MCGRYSVLTEDEIIAVRSILHDLSLRLVRDDLENYKDRPGEVRPSDKAPVIAMDKDGVSFENAKFGFKRWDGKGLIINARSETLTTTRTFSGLLSVGRCVVPAREYYEWKEQDEEANAKPKSKKTKVKHFVKDTEGNLLFFAGLYRDGEDGREFVIITKAPYGEVVEKHLHDRMPVILRVNQIEEWLNGALSPEEISHLDFNASVQPCEDELDRMRTDDGQISLF